MPVWSPGYYRVEDYAEQLLDLAAEREDRITSYNVCYTKLLRPRSTLSIVLKASPDARNV